MKDAKPTISLEAKHKAMTHPPIKGKPVDMGGYTWTVAPLTMRHLEAVQDLLAEAKDQREVYRANLAGIVWSLQRNYPGITLEDVLDLVDAGNYPDVLAAVAGASGVQLGNLPGVEANPST
jgi:hypothetical protein